MKYTKKERLSIYRKMRKYIKDNFYHERCYLCCVLEYDIDFDACYMGDDFPEILEIKTLVGWWGKASETLYIHNQIRLDALNKVIEEMTKSRKVKSEIKN